MLALRACMPRRRAICCRLFLRFLLPLAHQQPLGPCLSGHRRLDVKQSAAQDDNLRWPGLHPGRLHGNWRWPPAAEDLPQPSCSHGPAHNAGRDCNRLLGRLSATKCVLCSAPPLPLLTLPPCSLLLRTQPSPHPPPPPPGAVHIRTRRHSLWKLKAASSGLPPEVPARGVHRYVGWKPVLPLGAPGRDSHVHLGFPVTALWFGQRWLV